jgi:UPF0271 protein
LWNLYVHKMLFNFEPSSYLRDRLKLKIDINCDLGESYGAFKVGNDIEIMPHITSANIACGFHAGDPMIMARTVSLARKHKVAIGAHPGYPDPMGFGRRQMQLTMEEVQNYTLYQVSALQGFAQAIGANLQHIKPHGALYNTAAEDEQVSRGIVNAAKALDKNLVIFALPKSVLAKSALDAGLPVACEFFADRAYNADASLVSREDSNAIISDLRRVVERAVEAIREGTVLAINGKVIRLGEVHTICVHGDTPSAARLTEALRKGLVKACIDVKPVGSFV